MTTSTLSAPKEAQDHGSVTSIDPIIDIYWREDVKLSELADDSDYNGIIAVIHKGTEGLRIRDRKYHARKKEWKEMGLLWGHYHFASGSNGADQAKHYLDFVEPEKDEFMCLDYEPSSSGPDMTARQAEAFICQVKKDTGRYPCIYGGHMIREELPNTRGSIFSNCPLWYCRYGSSAKGVPDNIWPNGWTLWQYTDGHVGGQPQLTAGYRLDRNRFSGTAAQLKKQWPFTRVKSSLPQP